MLLTLAVLGALWLVVLACSVLGEATRRCAELVAEADARRAAAGSGSPPGPRPPAPEPPVGADPPQAAALAGGPSAAARLRGAAAALLSRGGVLGLLFVAPVVVFVGLNSLILGETLSVILNRPGTPLGQLGLLGLPVELTDLALFGLVLALAQLLVGAACAEAYGATRPWVFWTVLLGAYVPIAALEVSMAGSRGLLLGTEAGGAPGALSPAWNALLSVLAAWGVAAAETLGGVLSVHFFLIPLLQAVALAPLALAGSLGGAARRVLARRSSPQSAPRDVPRLARFLSWIDRAVFAPLRELDASVAAFFGRVVARVSPLVGSSALSQAR